MKAEAALVGEIGALFLVPVHVAHVRVDIDDSPRLLLAPVVLLPRTCVDFIDRSVEMPDRLRVEPTQKISCSRRIRNPRCAQHASHRLAVLQLGDVFDRRTTHEKVVGVRQHVIRLVKGAP